MTRAVCSGEDPFRAPRVRESVSCVLDCAFDCVSHLLSLSLTLSLTLYALAARGTAVLGHNYCMHHPPESEYKWINKHKTSELNVTRLVVHVDSFLRSINLL